MWDEVCLAVACHQHFWQNDLDLLRAIVVTRGWDGYRNESQHGARAMSAGPIVRCLLLKTVGLAGNDRCPCGH